MIRVNLTRQRKAAGAKLDLRNLDLAMIREKLAGLFSKRGGEGKKLDLKNSPIIPLALAAVAYFFTTSQLEEYRKQNLAKVAKQVTAVEREVAVEQQKLAQLQGYETVKAQLEADEKEIRTKLEVLDRLMEGRTVPSRLLLQVSQAMPEEAWLTELRVEREDVSFSGQAPSASLVSDFLKSIATSPYLTDISLRGIEESGTVGRELKVQNFSVLAKRRAAQ